MLQGKLDALNMELSATLEARNSDGKSSAGDKHEVGRAMMQQELDKLEEQRAKLIALQQELDRVPQDRVYDRGAFGSLVTTTNGTYFIAVGLGVDRGGRRNALCDLAGLTDRTVVGRKGCR